MKPGVLVAQFGERLRIVRVRDPAFAGLDLTQVVVERGEQDSLGATSWRRFKPDVSHKELMSDLVSWVMSLSERPREPVAGSFEVADAIDGFVRLAGAGVAS